MTQEYPKHKGFGPVPKPSTPSKKKPVTPEFSKEDLDAFAKEKGVQKYYIFMRFAEDRWFPCGSIGAPEDRIDEAIMDSRQSLIENGRKRFPQLRDKEDFEFGYQLLDKPRSTITPAKVVKKSLLDRVKGLFQRQR